MKVVHVVPGIGEEASGPSQSVPALCKHLGERGLEITLHVLRDAAVPAGYASMVREHPAWRIASRLGIAPGMMRALRKEAAAASILHNHSLWMMPNVYPAIAVRGTGCRLVTSPRGTLSPYALGRSRRAKRLMWRLGQSQALERAACIHATAPQERDDVRALGFETPIAVIPNGVSIPPRPRQEGPSPTGRRRALYLGRIHPQKGVDILLQAWESVAAGHPDWELWVAGPDNLGHLEEMKEYARRRRLERLVFAGPRYGDEKARLFSESELFVLPTHFECFGMAVAEALSYGLPVIVTNRAPWSGVVDRRCGWWIDFGLGPLVAAMDEAMRRTGEELRDMGLRGRDWMQRDYSWARVAEMMETTYRWIVGEAPPPSWVDGAR